MRLAGTLYGIVYLLMLAVIFTLPNFSFPEYNSTRDSLSELGAQATPGSWVMNTIFVLLGAATSFLATKALRRFWLPLYLLYAFSTALFFTAIWKHAPVLQAPYNLAEHITHSVFASLTGLAFCLYCGVIYFKLPNKLARNSAFFMCCFAIGLSLLMFGLPDYEGLFHRILFIGTFGWLLYSLVSFKFENIYKNPV